MEEGIKEGMEVGMKAGKIEGKNEGKNEGKIEVAKVLKSKGLSILEISEITGLSSDQIQEL